MTPITQDLAPLASEATELLKALAHPERLMICCQLRDTEMSVGDIENHARHQAAAFVARTLEAARYRAGYDPQRNRSSSSTPCPTSRVFGRWSMRSAPSCSARRCQKPAASPPPQNSNPIAPAATAFSLARGLKQSHGVTDVQTRGHRFLRRSHLYNQLCGRRSGDKALRDRGFASGLRPGVWSHDNDLSGQTHQFCAPEWADLRMDHRHPCPCRPFDRCALYPRTTRRQNRDW